MGELDHTWVPTASGVGNVLAVRPPAARA